MAQYQEVFQGKRQRFLIRSAVGADAPALVRYMSLVNRETTFLSMEPGEFERIFPWSGKPSCWRSGPLPNIT